MSPFSSPLRAEDDSPFAVVSSVSSLVASATPSPTAARGVTGVTGVTGITGAPRNRVLAELPAAELAALGTLMEPVALRAGTVLREPGAADAFVYFPESAVLSLELESTDAGRPVSVATLGADGLLAPSVSVAGPGARERAVACVGGSALRMRVWAAQHAFGELPGFARAVAGAELAVRAQLARTVLCDRTHLLRGRVATLLLLTFDRVGRDELTLTHEEIADLLNVRRAGVTEVVRSLHVSGVLSCRRGAIALMDADRLERESCGCYGPLRAASAVALATPTLERGATGGLPA